MLTAHISTEVEKKGYKYQEYSKCRNIRSNITNKLRDYNYNPYIIVVFC